MRPLRHNRLSSAIGCLAGILAIGSIAGAAGGCRGDRGPQIAVVVADVVDRSGNEAASFDAARAKEMLQVALSASRRVELSASESPGAYQAELAIALASEHEAARPGETGLYRGVQVELVLSRWGPDGVRERIHAQGEAFEVQEPQKTPPAAGFEGVLRLAVKQAVANLDTELESREYPAERLATMLSSASSEQRLAALRTLRDRKVPELVPKTIELLKDAVPEVVLEAVGVLVAQGDRRAVEPLIRAAQDRDQLFLLQVISALSELGGPVARGYLFTLAAGHDSLAIRDRAARALRESERAAGGPTRTAAQEPLPDTAVP